MIREFDIDMWYGIGARGRDICNGPSATYVHYVEGWDLPKYSRAEQLSELIKRIEDEYRNSYPRCGRQKLWDIKVTLRKSTYSRRHNRKAR